MLPRVQNAIAFCERAAEIKPALEAIQAISSATDSVNKVVGDHARVFLAEKPLVNIRRMNETSLDTLRKELSRTSDAYIEELKSFEPTQQQAPVKEPDLDPMEILDGERELAQANNPSLEAARQESTIKIRAS